MSSNEIPTIDLQRSSGRSGVLAALDEACTDWGFFQIVGHDIAMFTQMKGFFGLPTEVKQSVIRTAENAWGYYDKELTKNVRDWKEIFDVGPAENSGPLAGATPQWPGSPAGFRSTLENYSGACEGIAQELLSQAADLL